MMSVGMLNEESTGVISENSECVISYHRNEHSPAPTPIKHQHQLFQFPAWPKDWNVAFKLYAPGKTAIECVCRDGEINKLNVLPKKRIEDLIVINTNQNLSKPRKGNLNELKSKLFERPNPHCWICENTVCHAYACRTNSGGTARHR
ncbi:MAG: hypothetical protein WCK89_08920 [bacterium]